ncbi:MAG: VTT domain-containing protein [Candidatus Levybacteria bacterium]|nr:VTT domain-containing protein [Candidatus Levybacteria bacterium]
MNRSHLIMFIISFLVIVLAFLFQERLSELKTLGIIGIFLINFLGSATIFLPAPAIVSVFAGGVVYSPLIVAIVAALGATFGDMIGFFLGFSGHKIILRKHHAWHAMIKDLFHKFGGIIIFLFAFIPNPLFDGVGIAAGAFAFPPRRFFIFLLAGRLLRNLLLAYAGSAVSGM